MKPYSNTKYNPLQKRLGKLFKNNPEKSTIVLKEKCSDCGCGTIIEITPTSSGFGVQGGVLYMSSHDNFIIKCPTCMKNYLK